MFHVVIVNTLLEMDEIEEVSIAVPFALRYFVASISSSLLHPQDSGFCPMA
jgi:hypothetical protein